MKILLATDGSEFSTTAVEECSKYIASGLASEIKIVSVYEAHVPIAGEPFVIASDCYQKLTDLARDRTLDILKSTRAVLSEVKTKLPVEITTESELADPRSFIVQVAKKWGADMIIVGSHGRGFWGRIALGSVSDSVVHSAPCSVLVVRKK
jgi:nucleotide-binding universal stress UspA family protein